MITVEHLEIEHNNESYVVSLVDDSREETFERTFIHAQTIDDYFIYR